MISLSLYFHCKARGVMMENSLKIVLKMVVLFLIGVSTLMGNVYATREIRSVPTNAYPDFCISEGCPVNPKCCVRVVPPLPPTSPIHP